MSQILFGQSYYLRFDPKLWQAMQPYPPLGTLYAASFLREHGYEAALFDAMLAESEDEWGQALDREKPRFAVIYEDNFNYLSKMCLLRMRQAALRMIDMAKQRGCEVILCGSDASDHPDIYLRGGADFVLIGEGEYTLAELLDQLTGKIKLDLESILGLAYWETDGPEAGRVQVNSRRPDIKDLDVLPFPAWDLVDVPRYQEIWYDRHGYYSMNMVTTRGCPYHCNWCAKPIWGQRYNVRSPQNVVDEMKWLKEHFQPDHIWFADDIIGLKPGWLSDFADLVVEQNAHIPFKCLSRVDLLLREGDIEALHRAGAQIIWVGAESGSQKILNAMEKGTRTEQIYTVARQLKQAGIQVGFFLQFGYPGETRADIDKTLQMVWDCMPDDIGMSVSYPLPGTKFYGRIQDQLGSKKNWIDSSDMDMMYTGTFATAFYRQLHKVLHREYRSRKFRMELKRIIDDPFKVSKDHLRQFITMFYYMLRLPLDRYQLKRLEKAPHMGIDAITEGMSQEEAARPTPQAQ